ncbi:branched-chain amino acid aminotransferase [Chthonobacter rhizosphaerae]|uniref:branched-chain amino acid aminotransferase n=1 Tax=Chthonobacter rhizosphaerae TaxID=2735553 RepID=UPI0015EE3D38|nr:branched-chain amino acid aminotransferase [Chthonobacter rhizosphaerae]
MAEWSKTWTFLDGAWHEGNVPIMGPRTHAFWLGSSVFDGARFFDGVAPDLDLHCRRVNRSAEALGLMATRRPEEIAEIARDGFTRFDGRTALYVRPTYWAEEGGFMSVPPLAESTRFAMVLYEAPLPEPTGFSATTTRFRRPLPETAPLDAKAGCLYPNNGRALMEAKSKGYDNALVCDMLGNVAEFATANVFIVKDGAVLTPAANGTFLAGITRSRVADLLRKDGFAVHETIVKVSDVLEADEIFASGNYSKVMPVTRFEDRDLQPGPVARRARELYFDFAHS